MKSKIYSIDGTEKGSADLPSFFDETVRSDIIKRAVVAIDSNSRQAYGSKPDAGMRASAELSRRRHDYRGSYGHGISRVPRKILTRRGTRFNWVGAVAPGTVGGRRAHPPKIEKSFSKKLNKKENRLAIRSAIAACFNVDMVREHGYNVPDTYPFIVEDGFESLDTIKKTLNALEKLGFSNEISRVYSKKKVRAGTGKSRGRRYNSKTSLLVVTAENSVVAKAISNIPGVECYRPENLNAKVLAPGGYPGRAVIFTEKAINRIVDEMLFTNDKKVISKKAPNNENKSKTKSEKKSSIAKSKIGQQKKSKTTVKKSSSKNASMKKTTKKSSSNKSKE